MKKILLLFILCLALPSLLAAQDTVQYVDDESCGCELVFVNGIQTTQQGELFGFKREDGTVIVPNKYRFVDKFHGNYCKVYLDYNQCGLIDRNGNEIIPCLYTDVNYPTDGMILVMQDSLYGFFDTTGRQRVPFAYRAASSYSEGTAVVAIDVDSTYVGYGFIDHDNNIVIPPTFEYALPFSEGFAVVKNYDRYGMIDRTGREVFPIKYEILTPVFEGLFFAGDDDGLALYNSKFRQLTKPIYTSLEGKTEERILVSRNGKFGFLDEKGNEIIPCQYDQAGLFKEGRTYVSINNKWGIIDRQGRTILPIEYDNSGFRSQLYIYHDGLALIEKFGQYGFVDLEGHFLVYPCFDDAYHFADGLAPVHVGLWGYIDTKGDFFIPPTFDIASPFEWGRAEVIFRGEIHKMNTEGKCVKNCKKAPKSWRQ